MDKKPDLVLIIGLTAVGKTKIAIQLAEQLNIRDFLREYNRLENGHFYHDSNQNQSFHPQKKTGGVLQALENFRVGSVLRNDFRPNSDIDLLVSFSPKAKITLFDLVRMQNELQEIFGRGVDLVERSAIEKSENYIRRKNILNNTKVVYAAR